MAMPIVDGRLPLEGRLYRTPYLVLPRLAIEAMPVEWQRRLEALLVEADDTGLVTPEYYVLNADPGCTSTQPNDSEDPTSWPREFYIQSQDPWANYRHGDVKALNPEFKGAA
ncbi:hypothetical protein LB559_09120 [Mesorhizobium sp. BR1-1-3]|uniref:hypothetical protein n=1 Tax=Mesorhizobium sp. BR1-1-3 TaxID=2876651 RepID=UPI001CD18C51|nr:hypothetical protein [Mesorhizobium sp. BR1-1-3]MBZ9888099.1 hypothetical protein [Mesorhizobium sp. BR1-1-3]